MAQHKGNSKQAKAEAALIVRLEHSVTPDAEARLRQACSLILRAAGTAESKDHGSDHVPRDTDSPKEEHEPEHYPGDQKE